MNLQIKTNLNDDELKEAKNLYLESFSDSQEFVDYYFEKYSKNNKSWYLFDLDKNKIVLMAWLNKKRISIDKEKKNCGLIVAIAVKKEYQKQGIMKDFFSTWLKEIQQMYEYIFIQAYNWEIYKNFSFYDCTIKKKYFLKKDQFLKPSTYFPKTNYDLVNEIYNQFLFVQKIKNYTYRTKKENKLILKMIESANDKIYHSKKAYIIVSNNDIIDFGFIDFIEFIKLISNFPNLKINSYIQLDNRYFSQYLDEPKIIETKVLDKKNLDIMFSEYF